MENKTHGGKREGAGRKGGTGQKTEQIFGYRYTTDEYNLILSELTNMKKEHKTTSNSILEMVKKIRNNENPMNIEVWFKNEAMVNLVGYGVPEYIKDNEERKKLEEEYSEDYRQKKSQYDTYVKNLTKKWFCFDRELDINYAMKNHDVYIQYNLKGDFDQDIFICEKNSFDLKTAIEIILNISFKGTSVLLYEVSDFLENRNKNEIWGSIIGDNTLISNNVSGLYGYFYYENKRNIKISHKMENLCKNSKNYEEEVYGVNIIIPNFDLLKNVKDFKWSNKYKELILKIIKDTMEIFEINKQEIKGDYLWKKLNDNIEKYFKIPIKIPIDSITMIQNYIKNYYFQKKLKEYHEMKKILPNT